MKEKLFKLTTEQVNKRSENIDVLETIEIVKIMNEEDENTVSAVRSQLPQIAEAINSITDKLSKGGHLFYMGAGTSGRLGVLDASECPPTFGVSDEMIQGIMAGGEKALYSSSLDGMEDNYEDGEKTISTYKMTDKDVLVGISASGRTPYVVGALKKAQETGLFTIGLCNNSEPSFGNYCNVLIAPVVGPEVIVGSTRLKSGTSQKMVLNMLSTGSMVKLGKIYKNYMVDVVPVNAKLVDRAIRIIESVTGVDYDTSKKYFDLSGNNAKVAIVMILTGTPKEQAIDMLQKADGFISKTVGERVQ
ncbi:N-acetylmuramic acid 6-phosphate etherase [Clostridium estertheticum]|uniref:N-acetylmuramic acid 6-phosphate etherase n=1 Tax=Clostridium estertheticum TaxID=238834 RepID=UPI0013E94317|nr:N-acetylmuramic acid 6-phosphate etherase [Clostridium estertheticum]MBZ9685972.1 N-acetylmuramic acid 6-phosphate etherase [Clostridium estertheticum]